MELYQTRISKGNLEEIMRRQMTPSQIIDFLSYGATYRSFGDVLRGVCPGEDLSRTLRQRLMEQSEACNLGLDSESVRKNVRNWLEGSSMPQSREQLFRICFALGLGENAANIVLARAGETGIHYRNPRELVYAFALRTERTYGEALRLNQEMEAVYAPAVEAAAKAQKKKWQQWEKEYHEKRQAAKEKYRQGQKQGRGQDPFIGQQQNRQAPAFMTMMMGLQFEDVETEEELKRFFIENSAEMGSLHESAYAKFRSLLLELEEPDDWMLHEADGALEENPDLQDGSYSLEKVAELYLRMNVPVDKKTKDFSYLQKAIKKNWPGTTELQKMKARKIDVSRKALLLLFLVTEDFLYSEDLQYSGRQSDAVWYEPGSEETPMEELKQAITKLNLFLETYGMNRLDPGSPFDCLILYALAAGFGDEFASDSFSDALKELFQQ